MRLVLAAERPDDGIFGEEAGRTVSRSGLTRMGYEIAKKTGITMLGRASGRHYLAFTGRERLARRSAQPTAYA